MLRPYKHHLHYIPPFALRRGRCMQMGVACYAPTHSVNVTPDGAFGRGAACNAPIPIQNTYAPTNPVIPPFALRRGRSMLRPYPFG